MNGASSADRGRKQQRTALQAVAAILLVLHWILPVAWQAGAASAGRSLGDLGELGDLGRGFVSGSWASQPLDLPRLKPRTANLEPGVPNRGESVRAFGGKSAVLPDAADAGRSHDAGRAVAAAKPAAADVAAPAAFDARGPPILA